METIEKKLSELKPYENPKIAVEVLIGHGICHIIAETSEELNLAEIKAKLAV